MIDKGLSRTLEEKARRDFEQRQKYNGEYREANKEKLSAHDKKHYQENKKEIHAQHKEYEEANKEEIKAQRAKWHREHREERIAYDKAYGKKRRADPVYRERQKVLVREYSRKHEISTSGGRILGLNKRDRPESCELCSRNSIQLNYHHWDDSNPSKGVWVCNKCHFTICEAEDDREQNISQGYIQAYLDLKTLVNNIPTEIPKSKKACTLEEKARQDYEYRPKHSMVINKKNIYGVNKRDNPGMCEICSENSTRLGYHHWNDNDPNKGVWVCIRCHHTICEAEDDREQNLYLGRINRYLELKHEVETQYALKEEFESIPCASR